MSLIVKEEGIKMPPVPEGMHPGICVGVYDLGTHFNEKFAKRVHQCLIVWELPEERIEIEKEGEKLNLPRVVSKKFTMSIHEKALLRQFLQSWRGRAFTEQELQGFDITKLLGANCMVQIIHNSKDGKVYSNISSVLPLYKGQDKRQPENEPVFFSMQNYMEIPFDTPEWVQDIIKESEEWAARSTCEPAATLDNEDVPF